ncbi:type VI secretion protein [Pseudomonas sp. Leaf127]|uniref:type VI secretion system baseplate subunit TssK n=1 Tax=Pseudomonas sp. Leaf127 TaxID=1736267 RepID=UPI0007029807|nr:type VI secretion system baseplate subunit TssK [Pseudomonas sp. Leaf127]KQQ56040.1 type VI secretion protein [Pseudomonas sp. Leaf127]
MKIDRPLWAAGALLSPQQFQQQARWEAWSRESVAHLSVAHPWGVQALAFDLHALRLGKLKATRLRLRLPDGTLIDTDCVDRLPPALELAVSLPEDTRSATVVLALPLEQANGNNCEFGQGTARPERPLRFRQDWRQVQDLYGDEQQSVAVLEHVLSLRLVTDGNADYVTCALVRLMRDEQGAWSLDPDFVPPLLSVGAHAGLLNQMDNLLTQLSAKRQRLMALRRESNQRMADFAVADVSLFWLLNTLNTWQPAIADLLAHPARHPEQVYGVLSRLAGGLLTFSLEHDIDAIPVYQHEQLENVLAPLMRTLSVLLEATLPSRVIALQLQQIKANRWQASLTDPRLREPDGADFYLSVRCRLSPAHMQEQFPRLCKVGVPDEVDRLVNAALDGVALQPLNHVPAAIPTRLENQYFVLDMSRAPGRAVLDEGTCAFYVPSTLSDVSLELFAVLRT